MKMPTPNFLMANPDLIITAKMPKRWLKDSFHLKYSLLINIYKRLKTKRLPFFGIIANLNCFQEMNRNKRAKKNLSRFVN